MATATLQKTEATTEPTVAPGMMPKADPSRFHDASFVRRHHHYTLRTDETVETIKGLGFFKRLADKINLGDLLEVRSADLTYHANFVVMATDGIGHQLDLGLLWEKTIEGMSRTTIEADDYRIEHTNDVIRQLAVYRTADNKLMCDGFKNRQDAHSYITGDLRPRKL